MHSEIKYHTRSACNIVSATLRLDFVVIFRFLNLWIPSVCNVNIAEGVIYAWNTIKRSPDRMYWRIEVRGPLLLDFSCADRCSSGGYTLYLFHLYFGPQTELLKRLAELQWKGKRRYSWGMHYTQTSAANDPHSLHSTRSRAAKVML